MKSTLNLNQSVKITAVFDTGESSGVSKVGDNLEQTNETSGKVFLMPLGNTAEASNVAKLHHNGRELV